MQARRVPRGVIDVTVTAGSFGALPAEEVFPGVRRSSFSSERATVTSYVFRPGARFPLHSHPQEQITLIEEGEVEMTIDGAPRRLVAGDWSVVAPGFEHGIRAGREGARVVAIVMPPRERPNDYSVRANGREQA
jgi:quercetin dioxygenase-like cupin family protein